MVKSCAAYACTNRTGEIVDGKTISFHKFPLDDSNLLKEWLLAMQRDKWNPTKFSFICSQHFLESDYNYPPSLRHSISLKKMHLKKGAVPSVFDFPKHLKKKPGKKRNTKKKHLSQDSTEPEIPKLDHIQMQQQNENQHLSQDPTEPKVPKCDHIQKKNQNENPQLSQDSTEPEIPKLDHIQKEKQNKYQHLSQGSPKAKIPKLDHSYASNMSSIKVKKKFLEIIKKKNQIIQNLQRKNMRREKTIKSLLMKLKHAKMLSGESKATI